MSKYEAEYGAGLESVYRSGKKARYENKEEWFRAIETGMFSHADIVLLLAERDAAHDYAHDLEQSNAGYHARCEFTEKQLEAENAEVVRIREIAHGFEDKAIRLLEKFSEIAILGYAADGIYTDYSKVVSMRELAARAALEGKNG